MLLLEAGDTTGQKEEADDIFVSGFKHNGHDTIPLSCRQTWNENISLCSFHRVQIPLGMHIRIGKRFYCLVHLTKIIKHVSFLHNSYENSIVGYNMTKTDLCNWKQIFWHCFLGNIIISWVDITVWSSHSPLKLRFVSNSQQCKFNHSLSIEL